VDEFGGHLDQTLQHDFTLQDRRNRKIVFTSTIPTSEKIPYGDYDLKVSSGYGFAPAQRRVRVNTSDVPVIVGLPLGIMETPIDRDVVGNVRGIRSDGSRRIKLVSPYSDVIKETRLDSRGGFKLKHVPFGDYQWTVERNGQGCGTGALRVIYEDKRLDVELGNANPCRKVF
jgi:hypothetical protein